ncbi:MAG: type II toxin-antitoxin system RelE/ParE family toxin [Clostridiales bacterium]|nr:type II toxin-antitoxin system RelE/ParE family toxin [Clostridiales bacterium]
MNWNVEFLPEADQDMDKLDGSVKRQVLKGIQKVSKNPLPKQQGGYGNPLGNQGGTDLTNLLKIKFRDLGIRVVYKVIITNSTMKIIVISARSDEKVYNEAAKRRKQYGLIKPT